MAFALSERSHKALHGVHPNLVKVVERAIQVSHVDFVVVCGVRTPAEQKKLYAQGRTAPGPKVTWTMKSNHFVNAKSGFGHAVDVYPAPINFSDHDMSKKQHEIARAFFQAATELNVPIRWGADWDRDGHFGESGETDQPHFELWGL